MIRCDAPAPLLLPPIEGANLWPPMFCRVEKEDNTNKKKRGGVVLLELDVLPDYCLMSCLFVFTVLERSLGTR